MDHFARMPEIPVPAPLQEMLGDDPALVVLEDSGVLQACGRYFISVRMSLPLSHFEGPLSLALWLEIAEADLEGISAVSGGVRRSFSSSGTLACDVPGWSGSRGSLCRYRMRTGSALPQITFCADSRIRKIPDDVSLAETLVLYRRVWGNNLPLAEVNLALREGVIAAWRAHLDREVFVQTAELPPALAGLDPAYVCQVPPRDTNEPVLLATSGCSDVASRNGENYEIFTMVRNPSDDFVRCFSEFAYLTRMNINIGEGAIVPERHFVPDSKMIAWILLRPWWENYAPDLSLAEGRVSFLYAAPIYPLEMALASVHGHEELLDIFRQEDIDLASLSRDPVIVEE